MEEELKIKKRLIDLLNENESIKSFELLSNKLYEKDKSLDNEYKKKREHKEYNIDENDEKLVKEVNNKINELLIILKSKNIINFKPTNGYKVIKKSEKFKIFKKEFYIKLILNELSRDEVPEVLDHKKISIGEISHNDLEVFYRQCKMLLRENIITGTNKNPFQNKGKNWFGLVKPEIIINDIKLNRILDADELEVMSKIEEVMSEVKMGQTTISVSGSNINLANGDNNAQTININESELIKELLETTNRIKNEIGEARHKEIVSVLKEIKNSKNKAPLWEKFIGLTADIGTLSTIILQSVVPVLAMLK